MNKKSPWELWVMKKKAKWQALRIALGRWILCQWRKERRP